MRRSHLASRSSALLTRGNKTAAAMGAVALVLGMAAGSGPAAFAVDEELPAAATAAESSQYVSVGVKIDSGTEVRWVDKGDLSAMPEKLRDLHVTLTAADGTVFESSQLSNGVASWVGGKGFGTSA